MSLTIRRALRSVWMARGGGLYACGFVLTFLWLEVNTLADEIAGADSVGSFLTEQLFEFILRFSVQSIQNTVRAFLWPVPIIQWSPLWGGALLGGTYLLFSRFIKGPLTAWLFGDDPQNEETPDVLSKD